jgi:hypothetical protein
MAFTYSFPIIIKSAPAVAIPYHETPDSAGMQLVLPGIWSILTDPALFRSECEKHVIILDSVNAIRGYNAASELARHPEHIEACFARLTSWWHTRPRSLDPEVVCSKENIVCACVQYLFS